MQKINYNRRDFFVRIGQATLFGVGITAAESSVFGEEYLDSNNYQLELYAITGEQKNFICDVVALAQNGKLDSSLVVKSYLYAKRKTKGNRRYYYFEKALYAQCVQAGIDLNALINKYK